MNKVVSRIRDIANRTSRALLKEPARKKLVEAYYANKAMRLNNGADYAPHSSKDLVDWRATLGYRITCSRGVYRGNCFYGAAYWMQHYAGVEMPVKACIEHGVYFGNCVNEAELDKSGLPCLLTFGPSRIEHIAEVSDVPAIPVGPYIAYASDYLPIDEMNALKEELGRVLLVFLSHSVDRVRIIFETSDLINEIERVAAANKIDTVLVCLYYRDILNGAAETYEQQGFTVVTAGYREDVLFLSRLRTLISLSDLTMSNSVGTHVGYCAFLGRPHYVYRQNQHYTAVAATDAVEFDNPYMRLAEREKAEVARAFDSFNKELRSIENVCDRFWGFCNVLTVAQMAELIEVCNQAYQTSSRKRQTYFREILASSSLGGLIG